MFNVSAEESTNIGIYTYILWTECEVRKLRTQVFFCFFFFIFMARIRSVDKTRLRNLWYGSSNEFNKMFIRGQTISVDT